MADPIQAPVFKASPIIAPAAKLADTAASTQSGNIFKSILADSIQQVQNTDNFANHTVEQFLSGENTDLHTVAIAAQKAELSFEFFMQARGKVVAAYQEVMRMQL